MQERELGMLIGFVFLAILVLVIVLPIMKSKKARKAYQQQKNTEGYIEEMNVIHCSGLPIPQDAKCHLKYFKDKILLEYGSTKINLYINKINDMIATTNVEVQKNAVSSAGGAIAGAMMFGAVGAIIGGRTKVKNTNKINYYIVINYQKENSQEYIVLDVDSIHSAKSIVEDYKKTNNKTIEINL